jgi:hypothetical protein
MCPTAHFEREPFGIAKRLDAQINIKVGPIQMPGNRFFDVDDGAYRNILEPGEFGIRHEELFAVRE